MTEATSPTETADGSRPAASISPRVLELLRFTESHNRHNEALARATGENFNIFKVLRVGHLEVTTHSPILAELLNPLGIHGQGAVFLRLFLAQFAISGFDADTAKVKTEHHAAKKTEDSGGRMDIVVRDGKEAMILIENKIYAGDQEKQIQRYRKTYPRAHLFYLTRKGQNPSGLSDDETERLQCRPISYAGDILAWLKACRREAACLPNLRETITQYIRLIEELTDQSTTILMSKELIEEIIQEPESLRAFHTLRNAQLAVQKELIARLDAKLDDLANAYGLERQGPLRDLHRKDAGFYFETPGLKQRNLLIGFVFDKGYYGDFCLGFRKKDFKQTCPVKAEIQSAFSEEFASQKPTEVWPAWAYWDDPYRNWRQEAFEAIQSPKFVEDLKVKLTTLLKIARKVCPDSVNAQKR